MSAAQAVPRAAPSPRPAASALGAGLPVAALTLLLAATAPPLLAAVTAAVLLLTALVAFRPFAGALVLTAVYPVLNTYLVVHGAYSPAISRLLLYPVDFLAAPLLVGLALNRLQSRPRSTPPPPDAAVGERRWMLWFAGAFLLWAAARIGASPSPAFSLVGYGRVLAAGGIVLFLAQTVDTERRLLLLFRVFCAVAAVLAVMAVVATNHAFSVERLLHSDAETHVSGQFLLYNMAAGFNPVIVGMAPGYGLTPKHNLSLYLTAALVFSFLLALRAGSRSGRIGWGALALLFATVNQQAFSRLSLAGLLGAVVAVLFFVRPWRARIPAALAALLALYTAGFALSRPFFPAHMAKRESVAAALSAVASESKYTASSLAGRFHIWRESWTRIQQRPLLGRGPESIGLDPAAGVPNPHNLALSLWADYGLIGLLLAGGALAVAGVRVWRTLWRRPDPGDPRWQLGAALTVTVLCALFEYSFDMPAWSPHLWFMLGLLLAATGVATRRGC